MDREYSSWKSRRGGIEATIKRLGIRAKGRKIIGSKKSYELREPAIPYEDHFGAQKWDIELENAYPWDSSQ